MAELDRMIEQAQADRKWFGDMFRAGGPRGHAIEASACAIRERALLDAKAAIERERAK